MFRSWDWGDVLFGWFMLMCLSILTVMILTGLVLVVVTVAANVIY